MFLGKDILKICSTFTGEHPSRSVILIKLLCNFIEIALRHGCSPVKLLHIFRTPFYKNTSGGLLLSDSFVNEDLVCFVIKRQKQPSNGVVLYKGVLKLCSKFTGELPCRSVIEITLRHGCSPVNLLHIFRIPLPKNTSGGQLLKRHFKRIESAV